MKRFLAKFGLFLALAMVCSTALVFSIIGLNRMAVGNCALEDNVKAVIIGDSHTMWSIDAGEIDTVQNVSFNAEGYVYTYYKLKQLLSKEPNISHVYLGFGYHNLAGYYDDYIQGTQSMSFIHRYIGVMPIGDLVRAIFRNPLEAPDLLRNILQKGTRSGLKQQCTLYGSFPNNRKMETFDASHMERRISEQFYNGDGEVVHISESNFEYLKKIVSLLKENNVRITLLNTPLHDDYLGAIPAEYKNLYRQFIEENDLDVYEFEDLELSSAEFLPDGDHVNYNGAMRTTQKFRDYYNGGHD
jgi:hypothetical protein